MLLGPDGLKDVGIGVSTLLPVGVLQAFHQMSSAAGRWHGRVKNGERRDRWVWDVGTCFYLSESVAIWMPESAACMEPILQGRGKR